MDSVDDDRSKATRLLVQAMELDSDERDAFVQAQPESVRGILETLLRLASDKDTQGRVQKTVNSLMTLVAAAPAGADLIPRWRLIEAIGQGGMAEVYRAERDDGVAQQEAAVKLIWPGMMTPTLQARFEQERDILAGLTHPNIARLLDGGVSSDGRPWLATELVRGMPLDDYCADKKLRLTSRLTLLSQVVDAIAHSHRKLIVHRDIKPDNIHVDSEGVVKLLDFGIAKSLAAGGHSKTTRNADRMMTPDYSSPEQLEGDKIDTRSDIFQLGLLMYELIWGEHPFVHPDMSSTQRLRAIAQAKVPTFARRAPSLRGVREPIPDELHAIASKALASDASQRYGSAELLLEDLNRFERGVPVSARPPSLGYRAAKFVGRHRVACALAAALVLSLVGYATTVSMQSQRLAEESAVSRSVGRFMESLVDEGPGARTGRPNQSIAKLLEVAIARLPEELPRRPAAQARVLHLLGAVALVDEGLEGLSPQLNRKARRAYESLTVNEHLDAVVEMVKFAIFSGAHEESVALLHGVMAVRAQLPDNVKELVRVQAVLADVLHSLGRYPEAMEIAIQAAKNGPDNTTAQRVAGMALRDYGEYGAARAQLDRAEKIFAATFGVDTAMYMPVVEHQGTLEMMAGNYELAETLLRHSFKVRSDAKQPGDDDHIWTRHWLGALRSLQGDPESAERMLRKTLTDYERKYSTESQLFGYAKIDLGWVLVRAGKIDDATKAFEDGEKTLRSRQAGRHFRLSEGMMGRAVAAAAGQQFQLARQLAQEALALREEIVGKRHPLANRACWLVVELGGQCDSPQLAARGQEPDRLRLVRRFTQPHS